ncbi:putative E3 ubiquitin-protein ligase XBAT31 isoform X1 [Benincasa hispida]|uniref:putative E3 ubiquitin-protein ligase XBAT31 isoform X1 n=1 Tax=Benincasa hispida TaxID=102211 RepID=UPI001900222F|nr:putative E3 ubiquitin-protein ligase XBAT31 isoform X1 [Benincasa hispida]
MGQGLSCGERLENGLFRAVQNGDLELVETMVKADPTVLEQTTPRSRMSALHIAAAYGQIEILSFLLDRSVNPDVLNRNKQTPLMLATMNGKISCVQKLIEAGANILMFDSLNRRTCLHYAAYYGHSDCLEAIISAAHSAPVAATWGFIRYVNIRDGGGATPLHIAARRRQPQCIQILLANGALVCALTCTYGYPGSSPLHLASRSGSLECVRELLAWGAERLQVDSAGRIPYTVAMKRKNWMCAALLNPAAAEPLVWPSKLKFINELNQEAKALLERALVEANMEREKAILKENSYSPPSPLQSDVEFDDAESEGCDLELCCICFEQACTLEVDPCGHQMCAHCTLALCCYKKPNSSSNCPTAPLCPFCRSSITQLHVAKIKVTDNAEPEINSSKLRRSRKSNFSEGSSSFKSLSALGSFGKIGGHSTGRFPVECDEEVDKSF